MAQKVISRQKIRIFTQEYIPFPGGVATYTHNLAKSAADQHHVRVIAPEYSWKSVDDTDRGYDVRRFPYPRGVYRSVEFPRFFRRALFAAITEPDALFHAADWPWAFAFHLARRLVKFQYYATIHGSDVLNMSHTALARFLRIANPYANADRVIANSAATLEIYNTSVGRTSDQQRRLVAPLGVDSAWFEPSDPTAASCLVPNLKPTDLLLLSVGRLDRRKGHFMVLEALKELPNELADRVVYAVVGREIDQQYAARLKEVALACRSKVHFLGTVDQASLRSLYARADLFTLPGEFHPRSIEGFGLVFLEAGAQHTPSLATDIGGISEAIVNRKTGMVTAPGNQADYEAALQKILSDPDLRRLYGQSARKYAETFTWDRCAALTYETTSELAVSAC